MWKNLCFVVAVSLLSLLLFWSPWIFKVDKFWAIDFGHHGMETIIQNFDGLNFLIVAKSLYDPKMIVEINNHFQTENVPIYFSAHFPLFGIVIRGLEYLVPAPTALLFTIVLSNALLAVGLYFFFVTLLKNPKLSLIVSVVALFFPARMLSVRAVGSNEPLFMFFVLMSLALAYRGKHWWASILGALAVLTRSPGILLFGAYGLAALASYRLDLKKLIPAILPYLLMPLALLGLFAFYGQQYGDFFAYFHSGDNLHLFFPPFQIFSNTTSWVNGMWREDAIYLYLFYGLGITAFIKQVSSLSSFKFIKSEVACFGIIYGLVLLMVSHRDLARYSLPIAPIALLGFAPLLQKKEVKIILAISLIPICLFGWQFVVANVQPVSDWSALI